MLLFDEDTCRIVGTHAGDMIGAIALAIEMGANAGGHRQDHPPAPHGD